MRSRAPMWGRGAHGDMTLLGYSVPAWGVLSSSEGGKPQEEGTTAAGGGACLLPPESEATR